MTFRINANSAKNAMGTVFLLAAAFFVCSTLVSMRSVFADPIVNANVTPQKSGRQSPRATAKNSRVNTARTTVARPAVQSGNKTAVSRGTGATRTVSQRSITPTRQTASVSSRGVVSRGKTGGNRTTSNRALRARTATTTASLVSAKGNAMYASDRAGTTTTYAYLTSRLYTGSYSNIVDPNTGLISADAYSTCLEGYYTCMDEICTARSDTKGRCACAGRATNFLEAEQALERANEELIKLSGQLSLLIATKGKGDDLEAAFSLTDAEKVMNCVSWKDALSVAGSTKKSDGTLISKTEYLNTWCKNHNLYDYGSNSCSFQTSTGPSYCKSSGNTFGFDISNIDGSSSDILAQLKSWADAKDLAKDYVSDDTTGLLSKYKTISNLVIDLGYLNGDNDTEPLDTLANKWGYKLFEYAHNNVCGRVLDSCFNGIYEGCGTPVSVKDSDGKTHNKCANGATSSCPFNYNSYISVTTSGDEEGDVVLNERGASSTQTSASASCFGYTTTSTSTGVRTVSTTSSDPYSTLRGPVADARRSIMQKYLLDANAACDVYGNALRQTAQNINYQKIAAEQALQQKRLEFKQEAETTALAEAAAGIENFNECISEIWDCYEEYGDEEKWTTARVKAYCSQMSQVPHCYETMICSPLKTQMTAVIDLPDSTDCKNDDDFKKNTCRNVVTISEILYGTGAASSDMPPNVEAVHSSTKSAGIREFCIQQALSSNSNGTCLTSDESCLRGWQKSKTYTISYYNGYNGELEDQDTYSTSELPTTRDPQRPEPQGTYASYHFAGWCPADKYNFQTGCSVDPVYSISLPAGTKTALVYYSVWR